MRILVAVITILTGIALSDCSSVKKSADIEKSAAAVKEENVPYTIARNYFVSNMYNDGDLASPVITTKADFDKWFGMARTMVENGKPTPVDFSSHYVVAIIGKLTDRQTSLTVSSVMRRNNVISVNYKVSEGEKTMATIRPLLLLRISNGYKGEVKLVQE